MDVRQCWLKADFGFGGLKYLPGWARRLENGGMAWVAGNGRRRANNRDVYHHIRRLPVAPLRGQTAAEHLHHRQTAANHIHQRHGLQ
jgi:hypothetical protein